ncbi:hypothetical protein [Ferribacterium limneticum]|uniref:hypothetical protein n=1 Tax=Ferribacterium limneticum TaxID=76259 RepID=UPI001CF84BC1|nr:hypothetical protein [Ferribacterium limneticum]UCV21481.1 hypothetical protein KI613_13110 [Ferribacterium limneticum]
MKKPIILASRAYEQSITEPRAKPLGKSMPAVESLNSVSPDGRTARNMMSAFSICSLQDMLNLPIGKLLTAHSNLSMFIQAISEANDVQVTTDSYCDLKRHTQSLLDACSDIGLPVTKAAVSEFAEELNRAEQIGQLFGFRGDSFLRMRARLQASMTCLSYESTLKTALIMPPRMADFYEPPTPLFGAEVQSQFPSLAYEIEEAGKCFAVGRSTAAVFHLMRVMEAGIYAVSRCLDIPDPIKGSDKNWGRMLKNIRETCASRISEGPIKWANNGDKAYFDATYAILDAVRNAWRNTTMHIENKYMPHEAEQIFIAVRSFMMKLASRMDEQGQPLA